MSLKNPQLILENVNKTFVEGLTQTTWANRPQAFTVPQGTICTFTDIGVGGCEMVTVGGIWRVRNLVVFATNNNTPNGMDLQYAINTMGWNGGGSLTNPVSVMINGVLYNLSETTLSLAVIPTTLTFTPSIYSGSKTATTVVTGQSEAIAAGATKIQIINKDTTNGVYVGFGTSASTAETACSNGVAGDSRFLILADSICLQTVKSYTHYAWLGIGGTVSLRITQGT